MCLGFFFPFPFFLGMYSSVCGGKRVGVGLWVEWQLESCFCGTQSKRFLSGRTSFVPLTGNIRASAVLCPCRKYCQGFCLTSTHTGTCLQHTAAVICTSLLTQCSCKATLGGNAWIHSLPIFCWILYSYYQVANILCVCFGCQVFVRCLSKVKFKKFSSLQHRTWDKPRKALNSSPPASTAPVRGCKAGCNAKLEDTSGSSSFRFACHFSFVFYDFFPSSKTHRSHSWLWVYLPRGLHFRCCVWVYSPFSVVSWSCAG